MTEKIKRYAVPAADGKLCLHFGHCQQFALIDLDTTTCEIISNDMKTPPPHEPGVLPRWLHEEKVDIVLAGGMGGRAQQLFLQQGITVITGAPADTPQNLVRKHAQGELEIGDNVCSH